LVAASHVRAFRDRGAAHVLAVGEGEVSRVPGGVGGWLGARAATRETEQQRGDTGRSHAAGGRTGRERPRSGPSPSTIGRRLRDTEQAMVKAQRDVDPLGERLAATSDHLELHAIGEQLAAAQRALDALEQRWLELAEQQEG
jgi:ATP-binding cassette subfamily F protein uup